MAQPISNLAVGQRVQMPIVSAHQGYLGISSLAFRVVAKNHPGYPANSVTLMSERVLKQMPFDATEENNPAKEYSDNTWNYPRETGGNNRYIHSNIHQWMNSAQTNWYTAQHQYDRPPTSNRIGYYATTYSGWPGFLAMLEPFFASNILNTSLSVYKNQQDGYGSESFTAKVFLPSHTEMGFDAERFRYRYTLGSKYSFFTNDASRVADNLAGNYTSYYLRSVSSNPEATSNERLGLYSEMVGTVYADGHFSEEDASGDDSIYFRVGPRPVMNISNTTTITDTANAYGYYELIEPTPSAPTISYPQSGKKIYNAKPRFLLTINDSFQNLNPQEITAAGFDASTATGLMKNRRIILQKSTPATPGNVTLSATTKTRLSTPSTAVNRTATYEAPTFTDNPIQQNTTRIKAAHMNELRTMINDTRQYYGLAPIVWNETIEAGTTSTRNWAAHIDEMRNAISDIVTLVNGWDTSAALRIVLPAWIPISTGRPRADVMEQIRAAVQLL